MASFVTIYNYRAHNYFITIVMKFRNYFPSSTNITSNTNKLVINVKGIMESEAEGKEKVAAVP